MPTVLGTSPTPEDDEVFFQALLHDAPEGLIVPAENGTLGIDFAVRDADRWEREIWEGYLNASHLLLKEVLSRRAFSQNLIFPAMFNLRHAMEVALKWHIRYAGGAVPKNVCHDLEALIDAFRQTAQGIDEDATYIDDYMLDLISELAAIDPRSITFRYSTALDGSSLAISDGPWDLRCLSFTVDMLSIWFDHLAGYIDMSSEDFQAMLQERGAVAE
jgi:hypothetical protein